MDEKRGIERWGYGIPQYTKDDVLEGEELLKFGMDILWQYEFEGKGHKVIEATSKPVYIIAGAEQHLKISDAVHRGFFTAMKL